MVTNDIVNQGRLDWTTFPAMKSDMRLNSVGSSMDYISDEDEISLMENRGLCWNGIDYILLDPQFITKISC